MLQTKYFLLEAFNKVLYLVCLQTMNNNLKRTVQRNYYYLINDCLVK